MWNHIKPLFLVFAFGVLLAGCQTTTTLYNKLSIIGQPSSSNYKNSDEFVRDTMVYLFPRVCAFYETSDGSRNSENQRPDKFSFHGITENANRDGWYRASLSVTNAFYGDLNFYFNKDTGDYSCTGSSTRKTKTEIQFVNSRQIDLQSLPSVAKR